MNWWQQWKWFYKQGLGKYKYQYWQNKLELNFFYKTINDKWCIMGSLEPFRRNWIEKL